MGTEETQAVKNSWRTFEGAHRMGLMNGVPDWPERIDNEGKLDEWLSRPSAALVDFVRGLDSPLLILGAGGKMGPSLAILAKRAAETAGTNLEVIAASRFGDRSARGQLERAGVSTLACDLLEWEAAARLPESKNVIYLVGLKFGTTARPALTWAINTLVPAQVARRFPSSRIVALSTGNVYPLVSPKSGGAVETDPVGPVGEYAQAALARERIFQFFSEQNGTPMVLVRLNYAVELRYGVLVDLAKRIAAGQPVELATGYFNCIWQGDANEMILRLLGRARGPGRVYNLTGPEILSVRAVASELGKWIGRTELLSGRESETALLSNPSRLVSELGPPATPIAQVIRWTAEWVKSGQPLWDKPTHFEVRDGTF